MLRNLEHNHVAHERIVFMNIEIVSAPRQDPADRVRIEQLMPEIYVVTARFGFMETPDVSEALRQCRARGLKLFAQDCSFFLGWHLVAPRPRGGYDGLQRRLFAWMQRRSTQAVGVLSHARTARDRARDRRSSCRAVPWPPGSLRRARSPTMA